MHSYMSSGALCSNSNWVLQNKNIYEYHLIFMNITCKSDIHKYLTAQHFCASAGVDIYEYRYDIYEYRTSTIFIHIETIDFDIHGRYCLYPAG